MCKDQQSSTTKMRPITKEDALAYIEWLKNGGRDVLADHIFIDDFKAKKPNEEISKMISPFCGQQPRLPSEANFQ